MKKISPVLCALLLVSINLTIFAQRRRAPVGTPANIVLHNAGTKLAETDLYELYEYYDTNSSRRWCQEQQASLVLVFKVNENYVIADDDAYLRRFEKEILPHLRQRCPTATRFILSHYLKGIRINRADLKSYAYDDPAFTGKDTPVNAFAIEITPQGEIRYFHTVKQVKSLATLRQERAQKEQERTQTATAAAQTEQQLSELTVSPDGKLRIAGITPEHRKLFLQIYNENFAELARVDSRQEDFWPFILFAQLLETYSTNCRNSLSAQAIGVDFWDTRYTRTEYGFFSRTDYYERYLAKTIYVEPKYEAAFRASADSFFRKVMKYYVRERIDRDFNLVRFFTMKMPKLFQLALDSRQLITNNGCRNPALQRLTDNLHKFINGDWEARTKDGYKYAEEVKGGNIDRYYANVPLTFSPEFPTPRADNRITLYVNFGSKNPGLNWASITSFNLYPIHKKNIIPPDTPTYVLEAIRERKYFVVECGYGVSHPRYGIVGASLYFWNANGPLPSAQVQEHVKSVIQEPRKSCPVPYPGQKY